MEGCEGFKFLNKLRTLEQKLKVCNKEVFRDLNPVKDNLLEEIDSLYKLEVELLRISCLRNQSKV